MNILIFTNWFHWNHNSTIFDQKTANPGKNTVHRFQNRLNLWMDLCSNLKTFLSIVTRTEILDLVQKLSHRDSMISLRPLCNIQETVRYLDMETLRWFIKNHIDDKSLQLSRGYHPLIAGNVGKYLRKPF